MFSYLLRLLWERQLFKFMLWSNRLGESEVGFTDPSGDCSERIAWSTSCRTGGPVLGGADPKAQLLQMGSAS